jgi:dTDP-4-amino-4,6-dideoxygalactose transaminase
LTAHAPPHYADPTSMLGTQAAPASPGPARGRAYVPRLRPTPAAGLARATWSGLVELLLPAGDPGALDRGLAAFEQAAAEVLEAPHAILLGSGRAGILAALAFAGLGPGDEVLVPSLTAPCVPAALRARGLRVRIADVDPEHLVMTADTARRGLSPRTRAMLPTHAEGVTAPMPELGALAEAERLVVFEDGAHALGASCAGEPLGARSLGAVFSLGKGKHLNTLWGGLVVTRDDALARTLRALRASHVPPPPPRLLSASALQAALALATGPRLYPLCLHPLLRATSALGVDLPTRLFEDPGRPPSRAQLGQRVPAALAELGLAQLRALPEARAGRRALAARLRAALADLGVRHQLARDPGDHPLSVTLFHPRRDALQRALLRLGIDTQPTWLRAVRDDDGRVDPEAARAEREGLYLPLYAGLEGRELEALLAALPRALEGLRS